MPANDLDARLAAAGFSVIAAFAGRLAPEQVHLVFGEGSAAAAQELFRLALSASIPVPLPLPESAGAA